jgi:hypothetical protein
MVLKTICNELSNYVETEIGTPAPFHLYLLYTVRNTVKQKAVGKGGENQANGLVRQLKTEIFLDLKNTHWPECS